MPKITEIKPTRVYKEVQTAYDRGFRIVSAQGGTRSGKTYNIMIWLCVTGLNTPGLRINIIRATMPTLKKTAYKDFKEVMEKLKRWDALKKNRKDMEFTAPNGTEFLFVATEDEGKMRGLKGNINFLNEATENAKEIYDHVAFRTESKTMEKDGVDFHGLIILDYNPSFSNDHWVSELNHNPVYDESRYFFKTTYLDNPYLSKEQREAIEVYRLTDKRLWKIYGEGEQCMAEGLVFDTYFVCDEIPEHLKRRAIVGVDWGYKDPFVLVLVAIDNRRRELYLKELCYKPNLSEDQIIEEMRQPECVGRLFIPDPRDPGKIARMRREGLHVRLPKTTRIGGKTPIVSGIQKMKGYKIFITADSKNGIMEADNYTYERDRNGNWTDEPDKKHFNHFWDAARYVVSTEGTLPGHGITRGVRVRN